MPAGETVGIITTLLNKVIDVFLALQKTKRIRYSIEGNKIAYEYIKRVREVYNPDDKKLNNLEEKFIKLAIEQ